MRNIDIHCHPSQKLMLTKGKSVYDNIDFNTNISKLTDEMLGDILDSQSNIPQLQKGEFKLIFWSVYTMEREVVALDRIKEAMRNEKDDTLIDNDFLTTVEHAGINYFDYMQKEWQIMEEIIAADDNLHLISDIGEMKPDKLNVYPSLEGAHAFVTSNAEKDFIDGDFIARFEDFATQHPLSFVTLTHFTDKELFTHCFALKLVKKSELVNSNFYPTFLSKSGYSAHGEAFLDACIKHNVGIDVKHVSLLGRLNIYEKIKTSSSGFTRVLCSHAGVTGMSYKTFFKDCLVDPRPGSRNRIFENRGEYIVKLMFRRRRGPLGFKFNPQTINLFDEDIIGIISNGGMIGISLDQRILGASTLLDRISDILSYHADYVPLGEFLTLCQRIGMRPEDYLGEDYMDHLDEEIFPIENFVIPEDTVRGAWEYQHISRLAQTVMHIIQVGLQVSDEPWNHIALGSDYDGLIDSINVCKNAGDIPKLKIKLFERLDEARRDGDFPFDISPREVVLRMFEENPIRFYQR